MSHIILIMPKKFIIALFLSILFIGAFLRLYKLGNQSFIADEYLGINASYGFHQTDSWVFWDFNHDKPTDEPYTRASIYYRQVAEVFDFLPANEFSARLVSVAWGILGIITIFIVSFLMFRNPAISLLSAFLLSVSIAALIFDRKLRMYSMLAPVYFIFSYFVYMALEARPKKRFEFIRRIYDKTGLNGYFIIAAAVAGYISLQIHLITVNILPTIFVYLLAMGALTYKREKKYLNKYNVLILLSLAAVPFLLTSNYVKDALLFFSYNIWSWSYLQKVSLSYSYIPLAALFFFFGVYFLVKEYGKSGLWICLSFIVPLAMAIYVWHRSAGEQYIYFTEHFRNIIVASGIYYISKTISEKIFPDKKTGSFAGSILIFLFLLINLPFFFSKDSFYESPKKWSYPNYREVFGYYLKHKQQDNLLIARDYMSYYFWKADADILDYGPEEKLDLDKVQKAQERYGEVWAIFANDLYIKGDARDHIKDNFQSIETNYANDNVMVWRWNKDGR